MPRLMGVDIPGKKESVFGVAFSVLLYGEELTWMLLAGFALIFCAIVISEIFPRPKKE